MAADPRGIIIRQLGPIAEKQGYKILAVWENGFRHITNGKRPIVKPEDLQGIKLRVPERRLAGEDVPGLRRNPSPMEFKEVFVALQTGVMDGQENPLGADLSGEVPRGAEIPVVHRARLYAGLLDGRPQAGSSSPADMRRRP